LSWIWVVIGILGLTALGIALAFTCRKYKKIENKLQYELTDVRNVVKLEDDDSSTRL